MNLKALALLIATVAIAGSGRLATSQAIAAAPANSAVVEQASTATLRSSPGSPVTGQAVAFSVALGGSASMAGNATWNFGDGAVQSLPSSVGVQHVFSQAGSYIIQMQGTDTNGNPVAAQLAIRVAAAPTVTTQPLPGTGLGTPSGTGVAGPAATAAPAAATEVPTSAAAPPPGMAVTYRSGWNLVSGPTGSVVTGSLGSLYTFQIGDTAYEAIANGGQLKGGAGYWAYFTGTTNSTIALSGPTSVAVQLGPGDIVLIGNPGNTVATVSGADTVFIYDAAAGSYASATQLQPGQGGWASTASGGSVTISNAPS